MTNTSIIATTTIKLAINAPKYYKKFRTIQGILVRITLPYIFIIACIGFITNTATVVLLSKSFVTKNPRHKWTLIALALSDLVFNTALLIRVIHDVTHGKIEILCLVISFLSQLAELLSACFTVLFTVQRYSAVRHPIQAAIHKRSSPIISLLLIFICSLTFCVALTHANAYIDCHEELKLSWFIADALSSFIIPFSLILIFNILIVNLIRKHARSPISQQSTLLRPHKLIKNDIYRDNNKIYHFKENRSMSCSYGNALTLQGAISETDIDKKLNSTYPLIKNDNNDTTMKNNKSKLLRHNSSEKDLQASEISIPMLLIEKQSSDELSNNQSPSSPRQSIKPQYDSKKENQHRSSNSYQPQRLSHRSSDTNKGTQTTQSIRVTRMLILVSTCFLILNAPAHLCIIALKIYTSIDLQVYSEHAELENFKQTTNLTNNQLKKFVYIPTNNTTIAKNKHLSSHDTADDHIIIHLLYIAVILTQLISYASYSINFFLYSFSGVTFRTGLRQCFNKFRRH